MQIKALRRLVGREGLACGFFSEFTKQIKDHTKK